jgi:hypothetical protein
MNQNTIYIVEKEISVYKIYFWKYHPKVPQKIYKIL